MYAKNIIGGIIMAIGIISTLMGLFGCNKDTDNIDGGVVKNYNDPDAPKVIKSTDIVSFESRYTFWGLESDKYNGRFYTVKAAYDGEAVNASLSWHGNGEGQTLEFNTDGDFMKSLYDIVSKYDFAQYNGNYHSVSGLPEMFGASLDITFASDEKIYAYDNQGCFLSLEAMDELTQLFLSKTDGSYEHPWTYNPEFTDWVMLSIDNSSDVYNEIWSFTVKKKSGHYILFGTFTDKDGNEYSEEDDGIILSEDTVKLIDALELGTYINSEKSDPETEILDGGGTSLTLYDKDVKAFVKAVDKETLDYLYDLLSNELKKHIN